jgi:small subunit ribosomal protein S11
MGKKKVRKNILKAIAHVKATFNNTLITITDMNGETLCWDSAGIVGLGYGRARRLQPPGR